MQFAFWASQLLFAQTRDHAALFVRWHPVAIVLNLIRRLNRWHLFGLRLYHALIAGLWLWLLAPLPPLLHLQRLQFRGRTRWHLRYTLLISRV